jgi:hypothetical protein
MRADDEGIESLVLAPLARIAKTLPLLGCHLPVSFFFAFRKRAMTSALTMERVPRQPLLLYDEGKNCGDGGPITIQRCDLAPLQCPQVLTDVTRSEVLEQDLPIRSPHHTRWLSRLTLWSGARVPS